MPRKPTGTKKTTKPKHPAWKDMITKAIVEEKKRNGSSRQAIAKYIATNYMVEQDVLKLQLKLALRRLIKDANGLPAPLEQVKGSFKLSQNYRDLVRKEQQKASRKEKAIKASATKVSPTKASTAKASTKASTTKTSAKASTTKTSSKAATTKTSSKASSSKVPKVSPKAKASPKAARKASPKASPTASPTTKRLLRSSPAKAPKAKSKST